MRLAVTGTAGQVALSLAERGAAQSIDVVPIGRPGFDLTRPETILPALAAARADVIVNAAAYTAVDLAEREEDLALATNATAAAHIGEAGRALGTCVIHLSTDYVFDGRLDRAYREDDPVGPVNAYGRTKLAGERALAAATADHVILRTSWVYSPFGKNFVRTMLRLGEERSEVGVVSDQHGAPTNALDVADALIAIAGNLLARRGNPALRGLFHMSAQGEAVWADVAEAVFEIAAAEGRRPVQVKRIATSAYPTPARRPLNSRLDCDRLAAVHGVRLPFWRQSLDPCVRRLLQSPTQGPRP